MTGIERREPGEVVALRYIVGRGCIEMCWPCRVVADDEHCVALFIAAGSPYRAAPKKTAAQKRQAAAPSVPPDRYIWRNDTLRLMFPGRGHSVSLFWDGRGADRRFARYFVNMEEPLRRSAVGFDTADHTLDVVVSPSLECSWRDEAELGEHVRHGLYSGDLAAAVRAEGESAVAEICRGTHPCLAGWRDLRPDAAWTVADFPPGWSEAPITLWERRAWAYPDAAVSPVP